ncbi:MAG: hypothetical protein IPM92_04255 [Saprospiraceae bacterium]|nr:hypothetical protein [Saprospiraceae bacterium]
MTAINAIIAGILFIWNPTGKLLGMNTDYLQYSPFDSYMIPGIILFIVNGVMNVIATIFILRKNRLGSLLAILQGMLLCGWIGIQVLMVKDFNLLHVSMLLIGFIFIIGGCILRFYKN